MRKASRRHFLMAATSVAAVLPFGLLESCTAIAPSTPATVAAPTRGQPTAGPPAAGGPTPTTLLGRSSAEATTVASTSATVGPTRAAAPRSGGTLRYGIIGDYQSLDPQFYGQQRADNVGNVFDRLTVYDANLQLEGALAESWEVSDDHTRIKFNLRRGVQFHTGRELTAEDVRWSLERLQDPKLGLALTGRMEVMSGIETPDKYTVIVNASRPWVEAFDVFEQANIIDPVTFQAVGMTKPTGTGPFVFAEYVQGDHLRLVKNTNYWRKDRPYLDEVVVSIRADAQTAVTELEAGVVDIVGSGLPVSAAVRLQKDPKYQVLINDKTGSSFVLYANCSRAPTDNRVVRQALNYAIDRRRMADVIWHGLAEPRALPWSTTSPAYDAAKNASFGFDLVKAQSMLAQSGVPNFHLDLSWPATTPDYPTLAQIYQADLAKIGVDATLKPLEPAVFNKTRNDNAWQGLQFGGSVLGHLRPASQLSGGNYGPDLNYSHFKDDAYNQLASELTTEIDPDRQRLLYRQLNDYWLDQSFVMVLLQNPEHHVARVGVNGLRYDGNLSLVLPDVWLA
jgi:peptide/nickel transport system substrate-binding protein